MWFVRVTIATYLVQVAGLYASINDLQRFATIFSLVLFGLTASFKGFVLATKYDQIRAVLDVARYEYTECGRRRPAVMQTAGATVSALLRTFAAVNYSSLIGWVITPLFTGVGYVQIYYRDGTSGCYRTTVDNPWLPGVSETVYNWTPVWATIYATEVVLLFVNLVISIIFDCFVITMCFVLNAQFRTLAAAYETVGCQRSTLRPIEDSVKSIHGKVDDGDMADMGRLDYYEELIVHIKDNQNIIKKYDTFIEIVSYAVIFNFILNSVLLVTLIVIINQLCTMGDQTKIEEVLTLVLSLITSTINLYIYCYCFNYVNRAKSTLNFGLYSSNWTAMDLKFKKTLLLAMCMNSAHNKILKVSSKYIINLELFIWVIKMCYSIISLILNTIGKK